MTTISQMSATNPVADKPKLLAVARDLEASFLSEMLKSSGLGDSRQAFGGGAGEDQFTGFLVAEYADMLAANGGIGLAESIYRSLLRAEGDA